MPPPVVTTLSFLCPKCGTIKKSGKLSCCGPGGSWFGHCGMTGNTNLSHTWYEGVHACEARQSQAAVNQQHASHLENDFSVGAASVDSKAVVVATNVFVLTTADASSITMPVSMSVTYDGGSASKATTAKITTMMHVVIHISITLTIGY